MKNTFYPLIGVFLIFLGCHPKETVEDFTINKEKLHITTDTLSESHQRFNYSIEISYPKVNNDSWDPLQKYAMDFFMQNKSEFTSFTADWKMSKKKTLVGDYHILYQDDHLLSMLLETTWIVHGTSKVLYYSHAVNWNLKEDIPVLGNNYFIKKDSTHRILSLAKEKISGSCGINIKNFDSNFTFCKKGIHLKKKYGSSFPECYSIETVLEWKEIEDLLTDNGKKFLVNQG
jgi:hypothetical protein